MTYRNLIIALLGMGAYAVGAAETGFQNGSFEQGTGGYWINRQAAVRVDTTDSTDGKQCISVDTSAGGTVSVVQ